MPSSDRSLASLFEELVVLGFIKKCNSVLLKDFLGETPFSTPAPRLRNGAQGPQAMAFLMANYHL